MISAKCFSKEWLDGFKKQKEHERIQANVLEKMIYALHLLESLKSNGLGFVFKGGTSLVLLIQEANRFSIDIDILCNESKETIEKVLDSVVSSSRFSNYELHSKRSYIAGVPKAHYSFEFESVINPGNSSKILLDILIEDHKYPKLVDVPVKTKWIETDSVIEVTVPSIDSITGDKLTAFAPNTIGIPYFKGDRDCSKEICKQLFDLSNLIDRSTDIESIAKSFIAHANQEIDYKTLSPDAKKLTVERVLNDVIDTCVLITNRGGKEQVEKDQFELLQNGIKAFGSGFLMTGVFRIDEAVSAAALVAHLAVKILKKDYSAIEFYNDADVSKLVIENKDWAYLNKLKKQPDKSAFYYWYQTVELMDSASN